jgi:DNA-binding CsgD family transcriptional regulator
MEPNDAQDAPESRRDDEAPHPLFVHSLNPMLIADDAGRFVDANAAACLFLRLPREAVCRLTISDLTRRSQRARMDALWGALVTGGRARATGETVPWDLQMPDGTVLAVDLGGTPHFRPGRHLAIILFPAARALNERLDAAPAQASTVLTNREREILTLVALGNTGVEIAAQLFLSPTTVATHVTNALVKLGARNRAHGIAIALQNGELDLVDGWSGLRHP